MNQLLCAILLATFMLCAVRSSASPFDELSFIDHYNLRYCASSDDQMLRSQVEEIKANMDKARAYGIGTYVLFSRSFEFLVNYDFEVEGLGDLTGVVWPEGSEHRLYQAKYAACLNEVLDYAERLGIKVIFHTNQFDFPDKLYEMAGTKMSGSARVCPGKKMPFEVLELKIREFFEKFPRCAGLQLTVSETQTKVTECRCDSCRDLGDAERFARVIKAAHRACEPLGKLAMIRTWGGFAEEETLAALPEGVICSTKNTDGDFHLTAGMSSVIGTAADGQEVEFCGWREYSGYNWFPCYMGDCWAERIRRCADAGVKRLAVRVNWNHDLNHIFSKPYGNEVNIYLFSRLAQNPYANPDDLLRDYVAKVYPESAREAAFELYKRSFGIQKVWMTWEDTNCNDHSRVFRRKPYWKRVRSIAGHGVKNDPETIRKLIAQRRQDIDDAYDEAVGLIDALGEDVSETWRQDLKRGARTEWYVAQGNCDCILMYAAHMDAESTGSLPDISQLEKQVRDRARRWELGDPETYSVMYGMAPLEMLEELKSDFPD